MSGPKWLHSGWTFDLSEAKDEINEKLGPILSMPGKKGSVKYIALKPNPIVAMTYFKDVRGVGVKSWYDGNKNKSAEGIFKKVHYRHDQKAVILEGTIQGKPVYVIISRDHQIPPISIKRHIGMGGFTTENIDIRLTAKPYIHSEKKMFV